MILQKIVSRNNWEFVLDLHPHITVVEGLGPERRARMAAMITAVLRGETFGLDAVIGVEDQVVQMDSEIADELMLGPQNPSIILHEADLPGAVVIQEFPKPPEPASGPDELSDEEIVAEVEEQLPLPEFSGDNLQPLEDLGQRTLVPSERLARHGIDTIVYEDELRSSLRTSFVALERAADERDFAAQELERAESSTQADLPSLDEARAAVNRASNALREADSSLNQEDSIETVIEEKTRQLVDANRVRDDAQQKMHAIEAESPESQVDISGVQRALGALIAARDAAIQQADMPSPHAQAVLAQLRELEQKLHDHKPRNAPAWLVEQTQKNIDEAKRKLANAETEFKMASADTTDVQAVEQAHNEVIEAQEGASKRFGGGKARQSLEVALAKEQSALQRIGLPNYEAFRLQLGSLGRDRGVIDMMLKRAQDEMAEAEVMWDELQSPSDDVVLQQLRLQRDQVVAQAFEMVGEMALAELPAALDAVRIEPAPLDELEEALWRELGNVGVPRASAPVEVIAETWLEARSHDPDRASEMAARREDARQLVSISEAAVSELEDELSNLRARLAARPDQNELQRLADQARERLAKAEEELRDAEYAWQVANESQNEVRSLIQSRDAAQLVYDKSRSIFLESVAQVRAEESSDNDGEMQAKESEQRHLREEHETKKREILAERQRLIKQLIDDRDGRIRAREASRRWDYPFFRPPEVDVSHIDAEDVEVFLLSRLSALRVVGNAGSLPVVLEESFSGFNDKDLANVLGLLSRVSRVMQIVYLSDDPRVVAWASQLGPDFAQIQRFQTTG